MKKPPAYIEGVQAREKFERVMTTLFRIPKAPPKEKKEPEPKKEHD
jgi:hypothetical protein